LRYHNTLIVQDRNEVKEFRLKPACVTIPIMQEDFENLPKLSKCVVVESRYVGKVERFLTSPAAIRSSF